MVIGTGRAWVGMTGHCELPGEYAAMLEGGWFGIEEGGWNMQRLVY